MKRQPYEIVLKALYLGIPLQLWGRTCRIVEDQLVQEVEYFDTTANEHGTKYLGLGDLSLGDFLQECKKLTEGDLTSIVWLIVQAEQARERRSDIEEFHVEG